MRNARITGNYIEKRMAELNLDTTVIAKELNYTNEQVGRLLKGYTLATYKQLVLLARILETTVDKLLQGDRAYYDKTVVHCMNSFGDVENREKILDIIDQYVSFINE